MVNHLKDRTRAPLQERLFRGLVIRPSGCVEWTGYKLKGYGRINTGGGFIAYTHRVMYEMFAGPIPEGMTLDHLCRNPACANVAHLEPVPWLVNVKRAAEANRRAECLYGHPLDGVLRTGSHAGERYCKTCNRQRARDRRQLS
jgi:HNH endonuclease